MPHLPIVDSHIHIVDRSALPYSWADVLPPAIRAGRSVGDFRAATDGIAVEQAVMVEFLVDAGRHIDEAAFAQRLTESEPVIAAFVANAPVERGKAVAADLEALVAMPAVRAIRQIIREGQFDAALEPDFVSGVKEVGRFGLPFEIGVHHSGLGHALELVRRCPDVPFVLDHLGTPPIVGPPTEPWLSQMRAFAALPNVRAKLSGLMAGVDPKNWRREDVAAHLRHAIDCFGPGRAMYGSDWPMFTPVIAYPRWIAIVDMAVAGLSEAEIRSIYRDVAIRTYRLDAR